MWRNSRIIWAICACFWGAGIIAYILCAIIIPTKSEVMNSEGYTDVNSQEKDEKNDEEKQKFIQIIVVYKSVKISYENNFK